MKSFKIGGVHPPENKLSAGKEVRISSLPGQVIIPLSQSLGAASLPIVSKGDTVKVGTMIARSSSYISANIHSSVSGKVVKIDKAYDQSGYKQEAIYIDVEDDVWEESIDRTESLVRECSLSPEEIIERVADKGIVGMGGATFPTHVKLLSAKGKADTVVVNATECEPFLTDDHSLMLLKAEEILIGTSILMKAIGAKKALIGIENNKQDAFTLLDRLSAGYEGIQAIPLKVKYPQGGEKQLIEALLGRRVPSGKLPADVACLVQNVGTVFAVYEAVQKNKPLFERLISLTGKMVDNPCDMWVRIGTPVKHLLSQIDYSSEPAKIISGGPMMGKALVNTDVPVTKGTSGILLLSDKEAYRQTSSDCIRCSACVQACPMGLIPNQLMTYSEYKAWDKAESSYICDCLECGCCVYVCPSHRPLLDYVRMGKREVMSIKRNRK